MSQKKIGSEPRQRKKVKKRQNKYLSSVLFENMHTMPVVLSKLFNDCMISSECLNAVKTEGGCSNYPYLSLLPQWECYSPCTCIPEHQYTSMYLISWRNMFLLLIAGSMLHAMFSGRLDTKPGEDRSYFIDRNGSHLHPESTHKL